MDSPGEEAVELVQQHRRHVRQQQRIVRIRPAVENRSRRTRAVGACCLISVVLIAAVGSILQGDGEDPERSTAGHPLASLSCPAWNQNRSFTISDIETNNQIVKDIPGFLKSFRTKNMAEWDGQTYADVKSKMKKYKAARFSTLKNGDALFEVNCGVGLNTVLTLDILQQVRNVTNITVYGSDMIGESVEVAKQLMDQGILPGASRKGTICHADSGNLLFAPSNSFDLVFTSHLTILQDPLNAAGSQRDEKEQKDYYSSICDGTRVNHESLLDTWRSRQEWRFTQFVKEMVRIGKPGAPIIIEGVSQQYCDNKQDGDGVSGAYWKDAVKGHTWYVNPKSLSIEPSPVDSKKYDVFLKKFKKHTQRS